MPCPYQAINFDGAVEENVRRALNIIGKAIKHPTSQPIPTWMLFDGTYIAQCFDLAPHGLRLVDDVLRCVGLVAAHTGNEDPSTITYQRCVAAMKEIAKKAKSHGLKTLFEKSPLASEVLDFFSTARAAKLAMSHA